MRLEDLVDIEKLQASVTPPSRDVFHQWIATAHEIAREKHAEIAMVFRIYDEIPAEGLRPQQVISFMEAMLNEMPDDEAKKTLIRTEALHCRKFPF